MLPMTGHTPRVRLDPLTVDDAAAMAALLAGDRAAVMNTATIPWPCTADAMRDWVAARLDVSRQFAVRATADGRFVGSVSVRAAGEIGVPSAGKGAVIGYWTGMASRGQGLTAEAVALLLELIRAEMPSHGWTEAIADIFIENAASRRLVERLGFAFDTEFTSDLPMRGGLRTSVRYRLPLP